MFKRGDRVKLRDTGQVNCRNARIFLKADVTYTVSFVDIQQNDIYIQLKEFGKTNFSSDCLQLK